MKDANKLRAMQAAFAQALINADRIPEPGLIHEGGLSARQRLNVYYHHTRIVQNEALGSIYPAVRRLVGAEFFANMAGLYGERHPLCHGDLGTFGEHLPAFIKGFEPLASLTYLPDVARLEWACHESLHSAHGDGSTARLPEKRLRLAPHVRLLRSPFPVAAIWEFALGEQPEEGRRLNIEDAGASHLLVRRPALDVEVLALAPEDWHWLARFESPATTGDDDAERLRYWDIEGVLSIADPPAVG